MSNVRKLSLVPTLYWRNKSSPLQLVKQVVAAMAEQSQIRKLNIVNVPVLQVMGFKPLSGTAYPTASP
jgi:hypothetical protein